MRIATIYFTERGRALSAIIKKRLQPTVVDEYGRGRPNEKISHIMGRLFKVYDGIIFISSTGIAVRLIAPYIESKLEDPAVVVVDDMGKFAISLLSGHLGGANKLSLEIAQLIEGLAVITTASDARGIDAVDMFAMRNKLEIDDMEQAKLLTSLMVDGKKIRLLSNERVDLNYDNITLDTRGKYEGTILIAPFIHKQEDDRPFCILRPHAINIGIGCRRGKSQESIVSFIRKTIIENNLSVTSIKKIGTIDVKRDEEGIIQASKALGAELIIFSKKEISRVEKEFQGSDFVKASIGVASVCEPSAYLLGESIIVKKQSLDGITLAISKGKRSQGREDNG